MSLMLPGWYRDVVWGSPAEGDEAGKSMLSSSALIKPSAEELKNVAMTLKERSNYFSSRGHWEISSSITTLHLLSVISVANTLMSKLNATFSAQLADSYGASAGSKGSNVESSGEGEGTPNITIAQTKQGWSLLAALHCVLLPDLVGTKFFKPTLLEMLAKRWQDRCLEIREASQASSWPSCGESVPKAVARWSSLGRLTSLPTSILRCRCFKRIKEQLQRSRALLGFSRQPEVSLSSLRHIFWNRD